MHARAAHGLFDDVSPVCQVPNVAVIVTDGRPQDRVAEVAAEARQKGIEIFAVGVARADMASLRAMASPPFEDHVFLVETFDLIHQFGLQFPDKLCGEKSAPYHNIQQGNVALPSLTTL